MAEDVRALTTAEIGRLTQRYNADRVAAVRELAAIHAGRQFGDPDPPPPATEVEARTRALALLNGYAPENLRMPPVISREQDLIVTVASLDIVLSALSAKEVQQRAADAAEWLVTHESEWRSLCKEIVLTASRLKALELKAQAIRTALGDAPVGLPMAAEIGHRSVTGCRWADPSAGAYSYGDSLTNVVTKAISQKIVSAKEIKESSIA
jgi:hypothetical protein